MGWRTMSSYCFDKELNTVVQEHILSLREHHTLMFMLLVKPVIASLYLRHQWFESCNRTNRIVLLLPSFLLLVTQEMDTDGR